MCAWPEKHLARRGSSRVCRHCNCTRAQGAGEGPRHRGDSEEGKLNRGLVGQHFIPRTGAQAKHARHGVEFDGNNSIR
ncbi:unnamed protein product [Lampetra planeri]